MRPKKIEFLYTNIGRGHPFYLDGIMEAMVRSGQVGMVRGKGDVFDTSRGLSHIGWRAVRWLYQLGSQPGPMAGLYGRLRQGADYNHRSILLKLLSRHLCRRYAHTDDPLIVAHPILVGMFAGRCDLIYQHGELVVPREAVVTGASTIVVPTEACAKPFLEAGYNPNQVFVSGLCIEPALVRQADSCYRERIARYQVADPPVGLLVSSGAEPADHVRLLCSVIRSVVDEGGRVLLLARAGGRLIKSGLRVISEMGIVPVSIGPSDEIPTSMPPVLVARYYNRRQETALTARLFPWVDYLVGPAHERTNWSTGLGLPMFVLTPDKGSFAPANHELLLRTGTAQTIASNDQACRLGRTVVQIALSGQLRNMADSGWGKHPIDGFARIVAYLVETYAPGK